MKSRRSSPFGLRLWRPLAHPRWLLVVATALCSSAAHAAPGDHIRAGAVEIDPDLGLGTEYRPNVYRDETSWVPAADLLVRPAVLMAAAGDDNEFKLSGAWELRKYYFVGDNPDVPADPSTQAANLDRYDEFQLAAGIDTFKRNIVGFRATEDLALHNFRTDSEYSKIPYTSQFRQALAAGLRINPGPALEIVPGASWSYDAFRIPANDGADRALNLRNSFGPTVDAKWAFLPRTSFVFASSWFYDKWQHTTLTANPEEGHGDDIALPNSNNVKVTAGLDGRFTDKLLAQVMLGYGVGIYNEKAIDSIDGPIADAAAAADAKGLDGLLVKTQLKYVISPTLQDRQGSSVILGYDREFRPSFFTNYVELNELFADFHGRVGVVEPMLRYELRWEGYHGELSRQDLVNKATADLRVSASDWMAFTGGGVWQERNSSDDTVSYDDIMLHLLATFAY